MNKKDKRPYFPFFIFQNMKSSRTALFFVYCGILFFIVLCSFLFQPVNCFPEDGWFLSQHRLFAKQSPASNNVHPIAAPAVFYKFNNLFLRAVNAYTPEAEFYFSVMMHHFLLFASAILWFKIGGLLGLGMAHTGIGLFYVVLVEAAFLPQSFWSENISMPLVMYVLYEAIKMHTMPVPTGKGSLSGPALLGLALGLLITTRVTPVIFLPAIYLLLFQSPVSRVRKIQNGAMITGISLAVVLLMMTGNMLRYGKFEFTSNVGGHLWNILHDEPEPILKETRQFQNLRSSIDPRKLRVFYWELEGRLRKSGNPELEVYANNGRRYQEFLRSMVLEGVQNHPFLFFNVVAGKTMRSFRSLEVARVGKWGDVSASGLRTPLRNPLQRTEYLPAPVEIDKERQDGIFGSLYDRSRVLSWFLFNPSGSLLFAVLIMTFYGFRRTKLLAEEQGRSRLVRCVIEECVRYFPVSLFLAISFLGYHVLTNLVEHYHNRFYLTILPVLAVLVSIEIQMTVSVIVRLIRDDHQSRHRA